MNLFWNCGTPNISGTFESRNFKFGREMEGRSTKEKIKIWSKGSCGGHVTHFWNYSDPLISLDLKFGSVMDDSGWLVV